MSTRIKRLNKWLTSPPKSAPKHEVTAIINYAERELGFTVRSKSGSHQLLYHPKLEGHDDYDCGRGSFDIPVKGGQQVLGCYLQILARAILIVEEALLK